MIKREYLESGSLLTPIKTFLVNKINTLCNISHEILSFNKNIKALAFTRAFI
jgi:hypothetical protein